MSKEEPDAMSITSATTSASSVSFNNDDDAQIVKSSPKKNFDKHQPVGMFTMLGRGIRGKFYHYNKQKKLKHLQSNLIILATYSLSFF